MHQNTKRFFRNFPENKSSAPLSYSAPLSNSAPGVGPEKKTSAPGVVIEKIRYVMLFFIKKNLMNLQKHNYDFV